MALVELQLPLKAALRILRAVERIAAALDRAYPDLSEQQMQPPTSGLSIVNNDAVAEEQARVNLRRMGYKPDEIDSMIEEVNIKPY